MRYFFVLYITIMSSYMLLSCNCNANVITYPCVWLILWYAKVSYLSFIASIKIRKTPIFLRLPCSLHVFIALLFCKNRLVYPSIVLKMEKSSLFFMQPCIVWSFALILYQRFDAQTFNSNSYIEVKRTI